MATQQLDCLLVSGPTLAALEQSVLANGGRPCDGLLFGTVCTTTTTQAHDASDAVVVQETVARLGAALACAGTHSFYTSSGTITEDALRRLLAAAGAAAAGQQLVGWFSYRPSSPCAPSMREAAVSQRLAAWAAAAASGGGAQQQQQPGAAEALVFGLVTSHRDHGGATISLQHRFFRVGPPLSRQQGERGGGGGGGNEASAAGQPGHPALQPLRLEVQNLGAPPGSGAAQVQAQAHQQLQQQQHSGGSRADAHALPALAAALGAAGGGGGSGPLPAEAEAQLQQAAGAASGVLAAVEGVYSRLLEELQVAATEVAAKQPRLEALRARNGALRREAAAAAAAAAQCAPPADGESLL